MKSYAPLAFAFVGLVVLANWLASRYLVAVPLTGGLLAPAGVFCIGAVLVIRDWLTQLRGTAWTIPLIVVAGAVSYIVGDLAGWSGLQKIAVGSLVAFCSSELVEAAIFAPIRKRKLALGVALSATVGNAIDSWIFLTIAFGSTAFFYGQFWGKSEAIAAGVALTLLRRYVAPVPSTA